MAAAATLETCYLPADRLPREEVRLAAAALADGEASLLFDDYPVFTLILNRCRQIVYANSSALALIGASLDEVLGVRPGEALGCIHAAKAPNGCGTGAFCAFCGAARSLEASLAGAAYSDECLISRRRGAREESLDLLVWSRGLVLEGFDLILMSAHDISAQKRRDVLERVFYHDIANTAMSIKSTLELIRVVPEKPDELYLELLRAAANQLIEEIASHRAIKSAEENSLAVVPGIVEGRAALTEAVGLFGYYLHGRKLKLAIAPSSDQIKLETDPALLKRILMNMIKNALEAADEYESIGLSCSRRGDRVTFSVANSALMPDEARERVFQRSFSTKGPGRGLGTYGMKLLGERYLGGVVDFSSRAGEGTVFRLTLPLAFPRG